MPVLLAVLGALGAAAFWYYRLRDVGSAAHEVIDAAERVRGAYRRKRFRNKAESSPIASIKDPAAAAVALFAALASERGMLSPAAEEAIKTEMRDVMAIPNIDETFTFARWAAGHVTDPNTLSLRFAKLWMTALEPSERAELYDMASRVARADGPPSDLQIACLRTLRDRLGLTRT